MSVLEQQDSYDAARAIRRVIDVLMMAAASHAAGNTRECRQQLKIAEVALAATRAGYDHHYPAKLKRGAR